MLKIREFVMPAILLVLALAPIGSAQQPEPQPGLKIDPRSQPAVDALRAIARAISQCPEALGSETRWGPGPLEFNQFSFGPPMNVVWDVAPSRSARAPYLGYIEFFTPVGIRFPKETQAKYDRRFPGLRLKAAGLSRNWKYLYEYDIGPEGLKLARVLFGNMGDSCWEKAARNPSAQEAPAPASNSSQESTSAPTEPSSGTKKPNEDADSAGVSALAQRPDVSPVSFKSDPDGADITVDGKYVGSTPSATRLTAGDHEIEIAKPGFKAWKRKMAVTTGGQVTVDAILEKEIPQ